MKNIFISILILASPMLVHAQPYKQCLDGEFIKWSHVDIDYNSTTLGSTDIIAYGDILLKNIMYKNLYYCYNYYDYNHYSKWDVDSTNTSWKDYIPNGFYEYLTHWYIRESEDFSKIYIYDAEIDREYLISDMNLQVGDTFNCNDSTYPYRAAIVDSVYFDNGLKHIVLHYFFDNVDKIQTLTFIEGIGPDKWWFLYINYRRANGIGFNCFQNQSFFYKNNRIVNGWNFANIWCGDQNVWKGGILTPITVTNYNVFVQRGSMDIVFDSETNADISIYDMQGRLCYTKDNVFGEKIIIPTVELSKGLYLLRVVNRNNKQESTTKFIPQF